MKYTVITKDGSKWLQPINVPYPNADDYEDDNEPHPEFARADAVIYEERTRPVPYIGNRPDGTTLDESEVSEIKQILSGNEWIPYWHWRDHGWGLETRVAYTDAETHDLPVFDEILNNTSDDAKMNVSLQMCLNYWQCRCAAAERYIKESPCDPDVTRAQKAAYNAWQEIVNQEPGNNDQSV